MITTRPVFYGAPDELIDLQPKLYDVTQIAQPGCEGVSLILACTQFLTALVFAITSLLR